MKDSADEPFSCNRCGAYFDLMGSPRHKKGCDLNQVLRGMHSDGCEIDDMMERTGLSRNAIQQRLSRMQLRANAGRGG